MEERNLQKQITEEFSNAFTSLAARIAVFQTTQESFVESLIPKIRTVLPDLSDPDLKIVSAVYGISITDEALKNYTPEMFAGDVRYLSAITESSEEVPVESIEELKETLDNKTLAEKTAEAMAKETALLRTLTAFYQSNFKIERQLSEFNNDLILHNINQRAEIAIKSVLIRTHLMPLFEENYQLFATVNADIDLRYLVAELIFSARNLLGESEKAIYQIYESICEMYPIGSGDDLFWDMANTLFYKEYYPRLKELLSDQIEEGIRDKLDALEAIRAQMSLKTPEQGTDESLRSKVDSLIFETIQFGRTFDGQRKDKLRQLIESLLKRMALQEYGVQDIVNRERYTEYFMEEFFPLMLEYPQFLLPFIDIRYYRDFSENPIEHFRKNEAYMMNQFWFRMRKNGYKSKASSTPYEIANAFAQVIYEVLNDPKVKTFEV